MSLRDIEAYLNALLDGRPVDLTEAEKVLKLAREERVRVERLVGWLEKKKYLGMGGFEVARAALAEYNAPVEEKEHGEE